MIYDKDTGLLYRVEKTGNIKQCSTKPNAYGYLGVSVNGKPHLQQNIIYELFHGSPIPQGMLVDHINNIPYDNRIVNLQLLNHRDNVTKEIKYKPSNRLQVRFAINTTTRPYTFTVGSFHDEPTRKLMWEAVAPLMLFRQELKGIQYDRDAFLAFIDAGDIASAKDMFKRHVHYIKERLLK